jgi:hypothetical protein
MGSNQRVFVTATSGAIFAVEFSAGRWHSGVPLLPLFLVVHRRAGDFLPLRICCRRSDRSALAIR